MSVPVYQRLASYFRWAPHSGWIIDRETSGLYRLCAHAENLRGQWIDTSQPHCGLTVNPAQASRVQMRTILAAIDHVNAIKKTKDRPFFLERAVVGENGEVLLGRVVSPRREE